MIEATLAAATQLRLAVRRAGVVGMPGVRLRHARERGPDDFHIVVEDRREPGDEVFESRGIRFYLSVETASQLGNVILDLEGVDFVLRPVRET